MAPQGVKSASTVMLPSMSEDTEYCNQYYRMEAVLTFFPKSHHIRSDHIQGSSQEVKGHIATLHVCVNGVTFLHMFVMLH